MILNKRAKENIKQDRKENKSMQLQGFDFTEGFLTSNLSVKWKEAQEKIYEASKEVTIEEKYAKLGALSRTRHIQMKYLAIKK